MKEEKEDRNADKYNCEGKWAEKAEKLIKLCLMLGFPVNWIRIPD